MHAVLFHGGPLDGKRRALTLFYFCFPTLKFYDVASLCYVYRFDYCYKTPEGLPVEAYLVD